MKKPSIIWFIGFRFDVSTKIVIPDDAVCRAMLMEGLIIKKCL
jgi:hypothetical protein